MLHAQVLIQISHLYYSTVLSNKLNKYYSKLVLAHTDSKNLSVFLERAIYESVNIFTHFQVLTVCREMFAVEYFGEFRELYTTRENKNHEDMGVVANKHQVDS